MPVLCILWNINRMLITPIAQIGRSAGSSQSGEKIRRQRHLPIRLPGRPVIRPNFDTQQRMPAAMVSGGMCRPGFLA